MLGGGDRAENQPGSFLLETRSEEGKGQVRKWLWWRGIGALLGVPSGHLLAWGAV